MHINFSEEIFSLKEHLKKFPNKQLQDVYKYYLQAFLGPSHFSQNYDSAKLYLKKELNLYAKTKNSYPLIIGLGKNPYYFRVSLEFSLKYSFDIFLKSFIDSCKIKKKYDILEWLDIWKLLSRKLFEENIFPHKKIIKFNKNLGPKNYLFHHSDIYKKSYSPHYRVMHISVIPKNYFL